ncbi:hypothetical protein Tco_1330045 [Tanacetum coccineum]
MKEKSTKTSPLKKVDKGKVRKVQKGKSSLQLVDEEEQVHPEPEPQVEDEEYDLQRGIQMSLESFQKHGQAPVFQRRTPATEDASTGPSTQPEDDTSANIVCDTLSLTDAETGADTDKTNSEGDTEILYIGEEQGKDMSNKVYLEEKTAKIDEGQAGSDPRKTPESRPPPEHVLMEEDQPGPNPGQSHVALAGPNPELMHDDFVATVYPKVHERLKHTTEEHVHMENPLSSSGTLSSMKNLEDNFTFIPPLSTPVIDLTPPKHVSSTIQELVFTTTTATTTTLPPPPPPQHKISKDSTLAAHVTTLEQICANFEKKNKVQDQTAQSLSSWIFTLENHDQYSRIDKDINENIKEAVQDALQAPVHERFRELSEFEMKEILCDRMFESGSYQLLPEHTALYEALEASMDRDNMEGFMDAMAKSHKRCRNDQDPPPPPSKDSDQSKKKRHDTDASASQEPQA